MQDSLGLYISIPFCRAKCTFCNFASGVFPLSESDRYLDRVARELGESQGRAGAAGWHLPAELGSVYLGGGTPSTLTPGQLRRLFAAVRENFEILPTAEITIECAPGQITPKFLEAMVEVSTTRASLGVQSLVDSEAAATGRTHTRSVVQDDVRRLHQAGLAVNIDLIAGLPGQTRASWEESLEALASLDVAHASIYMFEVDEDSRLGRELIGGGVRYGAGLVPTDDTVAAMYERGCERLEQMGLFQYEISNFARPGAESAHNLRYWHREPYLGVGLDAHSMLRTRNGQAVRFGNTDDLSTYLEGRSALEPVHLDRTAELEEAWFLGLRLNKGVSLAAIEQAFGPSALAEAWPVLDRLLAEALLTGSHGRLALSATGRLLSNDVFSRFLTTESVL